MAAYNEAPSIAAVVEGCRAALDDAEILVVDDGSSDRTGDIARKAGARVVGFATNRGKGAAIRKGIAEAKGEILVFLDADGQDDPAEIPLLLKALDDGADMVVGSRFRGRFEDAAITPVNKLGNQFLTKVTNVLFGAGLTDTQAGFRCVRRSAFDAGRLSAQRYDIEVDLLLEVLSTGGKVAEVPVRRMAREHGQSKLDSIKDGSRIFRQILRKRYRSFRR